MATRKTGKSARRRKPTAAKKPTPKRRASPPRSRAAALRVRRFLPSITVNDLAKSIAFYTGALGFVIADRWEHDGKLSGVMLRAGTSEFALGQDDWAKGRDRVKGVGLRIWIETAQSVDDLAARIRAADGPAFDGPAEQYGRRTLSIDDPDGFHLSIREPARKKR